MDLETEIEGVKISASVIDDANAEIERLAKLANEFREKASEQHDEIVRLQKALSESAQDKQKSKELLEGLPGDLGHLYPLHERVATVLKKAATDRDDAIASRDTKWATVKNVIEERDKLTAELAELKAEIVPELERLEGHEKRLQVIVDEFDGKVKDKRLAALLREAKDALQ